MDTQLILPLILSAFSVMVVSLVGAVSLYRVVGEKIEKNLSLWVSFSAGVFLLSLFI